MPDAHGYTNCSRTQLMVDDDPFDETLRDAFATTRTSDTSLANVISLGVARRRRQRRLIAAGLAIAVVSTTAIVAVRTNGGHKAGVTVAPATSTTTSSSVSTPSSATTFIPGTGSSAPPAVNPTTPGTSSNSTTSTLPPKPLLGYGALVADIHLSRTTAALGESVEFTVTISNPHNQPAKIFPGEPVCVVVRDVDQGDGNSYYSRNLITSTCVEPSSGFQAPTAGYDGDRLFAPHETASWSGTFVIPLPGEGNGSVMPGLAEITLEQTTGELAGYDLFGGTPALLLIESASPTTSAAPTTTVTP